MIELMKKGFWRHPIIEWFFTRRWRTPCTCSQWWRAHSVPGNDSWGDEVSNLWKLEISLRSARGRRVLNERHPPDDWQCWGEERRSFISGLTRGEQTGTITRGEDWQREKNKQTGSDTSWMCQSSNNSSVWEMKTREFSHSGPHNGGSSPCICVAVLERHHRPGVWTTACPDVFWKDVHTWIFAYLSQVMLSSQYWAMLCTFCWYCAGSSCDFFFFCLFPAVSECVVKLSALFVFTAICAGHKEDQNVVFSPTAQCKQQIKCKNAICY